MSVKMSESGRCAILGEFARLPPGPPLTEEDALGRAICEFESATNRIARYRLEAENRWQLQAAININYEFTVGRCAHHGRFVLNDRRGANRQINNALREAFACAAAARRSAACSVGHQSNIIDHAKRLESYGHIERALDIIYDYVDDLARQARFDECDLVLASAEPELLSTDLLLAMLTATLPWKSRLRRRHHFFQSVQATLSARGESEEGVLAGLG